LTFIGNSVLQAVISDPNGGMQRIYSVALRKPKKMDVGVLGQYSLSKGLADFGSKLTKFDFISDSIGFGLGTDTWLYRSKDGGRTWEKVANVPGYRGWAVDFVDSERGYIGNGPDNLVRTDDGGATWAKSAPFPSPLNSYPDPRISFPSRTTGFVVSGLS